MGEGTWDGDSCGGVWGADPGGGGARGQIGDLEEPLIARHHFLCVQLYLMLLILVVVY